MPLATRNYTFHGLPVRDALLLKAMMERAAQRTGQHWLLGDLDAVDIVFYRGRPPEGARAETRLIALGTLADGSGPDTLKYPPRVSEVVSMLQTTERKLHHGPVIALASGTSWHQLVAQIREQLLRGQRVALVDASGSGWVIEPGERQFAAIGANELAPRDLLETPPSDWRLIEVDSSTSPRRPLETLMWFLGIAAGSEGVLQSIGMERPLRLRVWPYLLTRAPRKFSELANHLRQGERSASELLALANASIGDVAGFVNACTLCGFLAAASEPAPVSRSASAAETVAAAASPQRFKSFLGAIRMALGIPA